MNDGTGLQYFLTDHLGSVVATTDSNGTLTSQQRYLPFGGVRTDVPSPDAPATDYGYTGQRNLDSNIGLMDYKARFYSPYLNRFIQPDNLIPSPANPQAFNRYSYVLNSPVNFNDPTGHMCSDPENTKNGFCEGSVGQKTKIGSKMISGNGKRDGLSNCGGVGQKKCGTSTKDRTILVWYSSAYAPSQTTSYGELANESGCNNCSVEPKLPLSGAQGLYNATSIAVDGFNAHLNYLALNSKDIPVFANMIEFDNGNVSVRSLYVQNTTGAQLTVASVIFTSCPSNANCNGAVNAYSVQPNMSTHGSAGIAPIISGNSNTVVPVVPSGFDFNQNNIFSNGYKITVRLANSLTGQMFLPISSSYP